MRPLGIGLIGLGRWGRNYLRALAALDECRLVTAADPDQAAFASVPAGLDCSPDYRRLLDHPSVEAVVIASPDDTHHLLARAALEAGKDVLVEKPMATRVSDAESLVELSSERGLVLAVGHTVLYHPGFCRLLLSVNAGSVGRIRRLTAIRTSAGVLHRPSTVLQDLVPHDLAAALTLAGRPEAVRTRTRERAGSRAVCYQARLPGDVVLSGWAAWCQPPHPRRLRVTGTAGTEVLIDSRSVPARHADVRATPLGRQCLDFINSCRKRTSPTSDAQLCLAVTHAVATMAESLNHDGSWLPVAAPRPARSPVPPKPGAACISTLAS
jgi:predicted dehydrogenase